MGTLQLLRSKKAEILALAARHGATNVRVFGSVARGEDRATSGIDILVDMQDDRSLLDLVGLKQDIDALVGRQVDVLIEESISRHLGNRIREETKPL